MLYLTALRTFFSGAVGKVSLIGGIIVVIVLSLYYVIELNKDLALAEQAAKSWEQKFKDLDIKIKEVDEGQKKIADTFSDIDSDNIDLLCKARYGGTLGNYIPQTIPLPSEPQIVEVVKYLPAKSKVPVEPSINPTALLATNSNALSDQIGVGALNNAWKAYCAVTGNVHETCAPFK